MFNKLKESVKNPFTYVILAGVFLANQGLYYDWGKKTAEALKTKSDYAGFKEYLKEAYDTGVLEARKILAENEKSNPGVK